MKNIFQVFELAKNVKAVGIDFLNENEMQIIRGGVEPSKPVSRPRDIYDFEEE